MSAERRGAAPVRPSSQALQVLEGERLAAEFLEALRDGRAGGDELAVPHSRDSLFPCFVGEQFYVPGADNARHPLSVSRAEAELRAKGTPR